MSDSTPPKLGPMRASLTASTMRLRRGEAALDDEADDAAEPAHLRARDRVARVRSEARVEDALDPRVLLEPLGEGERGRVLPLDAEAQRLEPAARRGTRRADRTRRRARPRRSRMIETSPVGPQTTPASTSL